MFQSIFFSHGNVFEKKITQLKIDEIQFEYTPQRHIILPRSMVSF